MTLRARDLDHLPVGDREVAHRLVTAPLEVVGRFSAASNATLLVRLADHSEQRRPSAASGRHVSPLDLDPGALAVYKPARGEAPLWDFPAGTLHLREVAAYEVSVALGWELVPVTVLRPDGPAGPGSVQRFVPHDPDHHFFWLLEHGGAPVLEQLATMVVFDLVIDNADRKAGHVLREAVTGHGATVADPRSHAPIRLVDHGVSFHVERKLRTVGWHLAGAPVPEDRRERVAGLLATFDDGLGPRLAGLLAPDEVEALRRRVQRVVDLERLPSPTGPRATPWPLV